ncbi:hypothetical protein VNO77_12564 [Canavalia gladiata]|uniref:Uncharacterized protein n=1 Tax=Canavalia gladiata TaxID=3824 RepID=A0AAN9QPT3_CANGL
MTKSRGPTSTTHHAPRTTSLSPPTFWAPPYNTCTNKYTTSRDRFLDPTLSLSLSLVDAPIRVRVSYVPHTAILTPSHQLSNNPTSHVQTGPRTGETPPL